MRAVVLDTETTGLDPAAGDRIIEIAAIEIVNLVPTGRQFHRLIDPERDIPSEATRVHGFTAEMLAGKPRFAEIIPDLLAFLREDPIIAHNAPFDFAFLDAEFARAGLPPLDRGRMVDTLEIAKRRYPGLPNSLDALCRRFGIDLLRAHHPQRASGRAPAGRGASGTHGGAAAGARPGGGAGGDGRRWRRRPPLPARPGASWCRPNGPRRMRPSCAPR